MLLRERALRAEPEVKPLTRPNDHYLIGPGHFFPTTLMVGPTALPYVGNSGRVIGKGNPTVIPVLGTRAGGVGQSCRF